MPTRVDLSSLFVVSSSRTVASEADLVAAERSLGAPFPVAYRHFVRELGAGAFCGVLLVHLPAAIAERQPTLIAGGAFEAVERFWKNGAEYLSASDSTRLVPLATSLDGDELCMHLDVADFFVVFPRHRDLVAVFETFEDALGWVAFSGAYWPPTRRAWFEPRRTVVSRMIEFPERRVDDVLAVLAEELAPDADDGGDPPMTLLYARAGAVVVCDGRRLHVRVDVGAGAFLDEVARVVAARLERPPGD